MVGQTCGAKCGAKYGAKCGEEHNTRSLVSSLVWKCGPRPVQHFFFIARNTNHMGIYMGIYKDDIYREISRVHRAMGVKMGHATLLIHRHGTDTTTCV